MSSGASSVGRINLDLGIDYRQFNRELNGIAGTAGGMAAGAFKKLGFVIAAAFSVRELVRFGRSATELASNLEEVQNVVDVTFGAMAEDINQFSKAALGQFGLSELSAKKYSSTLGAMMKSAGMNGEQMRKMSKDLTGLTGDMASFYNLDHDVAFQKIRAGISGEIEPLKQLGISLTVANLEAYALSEGITKSYKSMTEAEKVLLRYNYLMKTTADAQGDFARTSGSWANQTRLLSEQWKIFKQTMGQGFINLLTPIVKGLNTLIQKLQIAAQYFKAFTQLITGQQQQVAKGAAAAAVASASIGGVSDAAIEAADGVDKANKKMKGSLSSFDQLNVLSQGAADSMSDIAGGVGGMEDIDLGSLPEGEVDMTYLQPVADMLDKIKTLSKQAGDFMKLAFGPSLSSAISSTIPVLESWKTTLLQVFEGFKTLGEPIKNWFVTGFVPVVNQAIETIGDTFAGILDSGLKVFKGLYTAVFPIIEKLATDGFRAITEFLSGALVVFDKLFNTVKFIFDFLWNKVISPFLGLLSTIVLDTLNVIIGFWDKFGKDIVNKLVTAFESIRNLFLSLWNNILGPIVINMLTTLKTLWDEHFRGWMESFMEFVGKLITGALDIFNKFIVPLAGWLSKILGPTFTKVFNGVINIIGKVLGASLDLSKAMMKHLGNVIDFIVGVFTGDWEKAWDAVKAIFQGVVDGMKSMFKGGINAIIDLVNYLIKQLNKISFSIPEWVPGIGGKSWGINIAEVPRLANGGLVSAPTLAMVGDNRNARVDPEVITPLSKLQEMLGASNQAVVEVLMMILDAIENQETNIELDGEKLTRVIKTKLDAENNRIGRQMVTIGGVRV